MTTRRRDPLPGWPAKYPSVCKFCDESIHVRDRICMHNGDPVHVACHQAVHE